ncbi:MAG TPA: phosphoadenylyl-sulfate reductase [Chitinophagaceae bacterium]|jgi:phosphoadenosine phosphosulfate reductase|nr:phosphoadenylyl-sulfate reductase [Chitinophagaceae bacterium]
MTKEDLKYQIAGLSISDLLLKAASIFPGEVAFSSSMGQEDQVITDVIYKNNIPIRIFTIDTGRLFSETYELIEKTNARYRQHIEIFFPESEGVEKYVKANGVNGFYETVEKRKACCYIRKVKPLQRALKDVRIWITGLRSAQSENRKEMESVEEDFSFNLFKLNPLIHWSYQEVLDYLNEHIVPYNPLHNKGFISIGCQPCTRAIEPHEDPRAGRWWWEDSHKECGLHSNPNK